MKIYLINPPSGFLINERNNIPHGLLYIHAILEENGFDVEVIDFAGVDEKDCVLPKDGDIYGFTSTTPQFAIVCRLAESVKTEKNRMVIGGVHATILPEETLKNSVFDIAVMREGEYPMLELCQSPTNLHEIKGIAFKTPSGVKINPPRPLVDMDNIPHPKLSAIEHNSYICYVFNTPGNPHVRGCPITTSRGCPFNCAFCCSRAINIRKVHSHSPEYVGKYLDYLNSYGYHNFAVCDDNILTRGSKLAPFAKQFSDRNALWRAQIRGDMLTPEKAELVRKHGCLQFDLGVESGSQRILDVINKGEEVADNGRAIEIARAAGVKVKAYLLCGLPTERQEDIDQTIEFLDKYRPDSVTLSTFTPFPGCNIAENPEAFGYEIDRSIPYTAYIGIGMKKAYDSVAVEEFRLQTIDFSEQLQKAIAKYSKTTNLIGKERIGYKDEA